MTLVSKRLQKFTKVVCVTDRYVILTVGDILLVNVYFPCVGTINRLLVYEEIIDKLTLWVQKYSCHNVIIGGDLNTDLDKVNPATEVICNFIAENNYSRCDRLFHGNYLPTYHNESLNHESYIDYFVVSKADAVLSYSVLDLNINLSDHRPICIVYSVTFDRIASCNDVDDDVQYSSSVDCVPQLRWDKADLQLYFDLTGYYLQPIYSELLELEYSCSITTDIIDCLYNRIVDILTYSAAMAVPKCKKNFFKFWWDSDLDEMKQKSIASCKLWKEAGKPRSGPIFTIYRRDKALYKNTIRRCQKEEREYYTNDLHEAILTKHGDAFWKCWKSKFESKQGRVNLVDGLTDERLIAKQFADHFSNVCTNRSSLRAAEQRATYERKRSDYRGNVDDNRYRFDVELVENVVIKMKRGKAAGLDKITAEHLRFSHYLLYCILCKLFNLMLVCSHVPGCFGMSYTVPIIKSNVRANSKTITVDDFRGISISPIISKVFEHCVLERYCDYLNTSDNQFGFKKGMSCGHATYALRSAIDYYVYYGSTVNVCSVDLSKAFDKMNHHALFLKLMERKIPCNLLCVLEKWFAVSISCVKWGSSYSNFFRLLCGVRQGGVLSPFLFAIFIDSIVDKVKATGVGCYLNSVCVSILLYADDIILTAPSVRTLQHLLDVCQQELDYLDMSINAKKSFCIRIGPRFNVDCCCVVTRDNHELAWCSSIRYLGIYITSATTFRSSVSHNKQATYRAFNAIFGKVGRAASAEVMVQLFNSKCLPILYYGTDVCPLTTKQINSLQFVINSCFSKMFMIKCDDDIRYCQNAFGCLPVADIVKRRTCKFKI